jgi:rare lipoprotein A
MLEDQILASGITQCPTAAFGFTSRMFDRSLRLLICLITSLNLASCRSTGEVQSGSGSVARPQVLETQNGIASRYVDRRTASGERFDPKKLTAAHRSWRFGTQVRVTNLNSGKQTIVRINDRGPYTRGRIIDLTPAAADAIGLTHRMGLARVRLERLASPTTPSRGRDD